MVRWGWKDTPASVSQNQDDKTSPGLWWLRGLPLLEKVSSFPTSQCSECPSAWGILKREPLWRHGIRPAKEDFQEKLIPHHGFSCLPALTEQLLPRPGTEQVQRHKAVSGVPAGWVNGLHWRVPATLRGPNFQPIGIPAFSVVADLDTLSASTGKPLVSISEEQHWEGRRLNYLAEEDSIWACLTFRPMPLPGHCLLFCAVSPVQCYKGRESLGLGMLLK